MPDDRRIGGCGCGAARGWPGRGRGGIRPGPLWHHRFVPGRLACCRRVSQPTRVRPLDWLGCSAPGISAMRCRGSSSRFWWMWPSRLDGPVCVGFMAAGWRCFGGWLSGWRRWLGRLGLALTLPAVPNWPAPISFTGFPWAMFRKSWWIAWRVSPWRGLALTVDLLTLRPPARLHARGGCRNRALCFYAWAGLVAWPGAMAPSPIDRTWPSAWSSPTLPNTTNGTPGKSRLFDRPLLDSTARLRRAAPIW